MVLALERLGGILLIVTGGAVFAGIIIVLLFGISKAADLTSFAGGSMFKKDYLTDFNSEVQGSQAKITWTLKNEKEIDTPRVYYLNNPDIYSTDELRSTKYSREGGDFVPNAKTEVVLNLKPGISRAEIAAFNKNGDLVQKKEFYFMMFDQGMLDRFNFDLNGDECKDFTKCNSIACKRADLEETQFTKKQDHLSFSLTEEQLAGLVRSINSNCKFPVSRETSYTRRLEGCTNDEIYALFEDAITLKANEEQVSRDTIYEGTYSAKCIGALRSTLINRGWGELQ